MVNTTNQIPEKKQIISRAVRLAVEARMNVLREETHTATEEPIFSKPKPVDGAPNRFTMANLSMCLLMEKIENTKSVRLLSASIKLEPTLSITYGGDKITISVHNDGEVQKYTVSYSPFSYPPFVVTDLSGNRYDLLGNLLPEKKHWYTGLWGWYQDKRKLSQFEEDQREYIARLGLLRADKGELTRETIACLFPLLQMECPNCDFGQVPDNI